MNPSLALIDKIDSGLDVDALNVVSNELNKMQNKHFVAIIVSHYDRFFNLVQPTHAHVIVKDKIVKSGNYNLVKKINEEGYEWLLQELNSTVENKQRGVKPLVGIGYDAQKGK